MLVQKMYGADGFYWELIKGLDSKGAHVILPNDGVLVGALHEVRLRSACWFIRFYEGVF